MRITFQYQNLRYQEALRKSMNEAMSAMDRVNKKRELLTPESSPSRYVAAYNIQRMINENQQFLANAENSQNWLTQAENAITQALTLVRKVRDDLAVNGANGVNSLESWRALAGDVMGVYNQLFDIANTKYMGRYIFAGYQTNTVPFMQSTNKVSSILQYDGAGGDVIPREAFTDMPELAAGRYSVRVDISPSDPNTGILRITDKNGREIVLDSNGSDDTLIGGNGVTNSLSFKIEPGKIINTGRGVAIRIPENFTGSLRYEFTYEPGNYAGYYGDNGQIVNKIGYNQSATINFTGKQLFLENNKILKSVQYNTVHGMAINAASLFSQIDNAHVALGDSITVSGTDHHGFAVGTAKVTGADEVKLNMSGLSREERTLTIAYGGKYYQIEVPALGYKDMDQLVTTINHQLKSATYIGHENINSPYQNEAALAAQHRADIAAYSDFSVPADPSLQVDLSGAVTVSADGARLLFVSSDTGNKTTLSITGAKHNPMGFDDQTVISVGKDTVFEVGYDFKENGIHTLSTTHNAVDFSGNTGTLQFIINGQTISIDKAAFNSLSSDKEKELFLDRELKKAGFNRSVSAQLTSTGNPDEYDVTFRMDNVNFDRNTHLSTMLYLPNGTSDYQMGTLPKEIEGYQKEKTVGDYLNFIRDLYDNAVEVYLENGSVVVEDIRSGASRMTMNVRENNEGIGLPIVDQETIVSGSYNGYFDDKWSVTIDMKHDPAKGTKEVYVVVYNQKGQKIVEKTVPNYTGGAIDLQNGVQVVLGDMNTNQPPYTARSTFSLTLTGNSSLNFGDMNTVQTGENANVFTSLMNLYNALYNGINEAGRSEPSAWRDTALNSTAIPYFDGVFGGNFNAQWKYEVLSTNGRTNFYIQDMFKESSAEIKLLDAGLDTLGVPIAPDLTFDIQLYDNETGSFYTRPVTVPIYELDPVSGLYVKKINTDGELQAAIIQAINDDPTLHSKGVHAVANGRKIEFQSGSGTVNINVVPKSEFDVYMMGYDAEVGKKLGSDFTNPSRFDVTYYDAATSAWVNTTISLSGDYGNLNTALAAINAQLPPALGFTASILDGRLVIGNSNIPAIPFYINNVMDPSGNLGLTNVTGEYEKGDTLLHLDLTNATEAERTLTFRYEDAAGIHTRNITIPNKAFNDYGEMLNEINTLIAADSDLAGKFSAAMTGDILSFKHDPALTAFSIEGDNSGYLGFKRTGDAVNLKVTDQNGRTIQNLTVKTAEEEYWVSDGLLLGFDAGTLVSTDSFTGNVGSGVRFELGILDMVENQLLQAITQTGNRQLRVETVINFQSSLVSTYETQKAGHLGSTEFDQVKLTTEYELATKAYEFAMALTSKMMSMSILNYL